jgi:hypothetical protein
MYVLSTGDPSPDPKQRKKGGKTMPPPTFGAGLFSSALERHPRKKGKKDAAADVPPTAIHE